MPRRYANDWRPGTDLEALRARAAMWAGVRAFFAERDVMEVDTPLLGASFGTDPSIEALSCRFAGPGYPQGKELFLQSSPEFFMKRLLAAGSGPIYQLCKAFRNGEAGRRHNPEFSILEWYRPGFSARQLMDELGELIRCLLDDAALPVEWRSYQSLYLEHLGIDPLEADTEALQRYAQTQNLFVGDSLSMDRDDWLNLLMVSFIEPQLGRGGLCFVVDYPASQASLARLNTHDERTAARFELYWKGVELANGFEELTDPGEQSERFERENCRRFSGGQRPMPVDDALLAALESGMPACAGVALGLDRVLMCQLGVEDIDRVQPFSLARL
jgi:elongation factor P--(R)-beta-lysine ligase